MKLKVSIPIVKVSSDSWDKYRTDGTLEIDFDDSIDEQKVNTLLTRIGGQFLLIEKVNLSNELVHQKEQELADVKAQLRTARLQLDRVSDFLKGIGINPRDQVLRFDENLKLRSAELDRELDETDEGEDSEDSFLEDD